MAKSYRRSPRSEPQRIYEYFCKLMRLQPGELNLKLKRKADFNALVGQFFVDPKRKKRWAKLKKTMRGWHEKIEKQQETGNSVRRKRPSTSDDLWMLLGQFYWNYGAWIILRGEYKAMKKPLLDHQIEKLLKERYGYLPQIKKDGWFGEVNKGYPMDLAYRDTAAENRGLGEESLRVMLSPGNLEKSPPASLVLVSMNPKTLLSRLERIPPFRRTVKTKTLIRAIKAEAYYPFEDGKNQDPH